MDGGTNWHRCCVGVVVVALCRDGDGKRGGDPDKVNNNIFPVHPSATKAGNWPQGGGNR